MNRRAAPPAKNADLGALAKFALAGALNTGVDYGLFLALTRSAGVRLFKKGEPR